MHTYADDTQLYLHCCVDDTADAVTRLEIGLDDVSRWMAVNRLKLNVEKTELLWAGWVEVQCWGSAWQQWSWSVGAVWHRGYLCKWPRPCSRSNSFDDIPLFHIYGMSSQQSQITLLHMGWLLIFYSPVLTCFFSLCLLSLWTSTWLMSAHTAFIGCANFDEADDP